MYFHRDQTQFRCSPNEPKESIFPKKCAICLRLEIKDPVEVLDNDDYFVHVYTSHPEHNKGIILGKTFDES